MSRSATLSDVGRHLRHLATGRTPAALRPKYDTGDVVQESLLQVWLELRNGTRTEADYSRALLRTMAHGHGAKLADSYQCKSRSVAREQQLSDECGAKAATSDRSTANSNFELITELLKLTTQLNSETREILDRRFVRGQSFNLIAAEMDIAAHTVRRRYKSAIDELRRGLSDADD